MGGRPVPERAWATTVRPSCWLHPRGLALLGPDPSPGRWEPSQPGWVIARNALQTLGAGVPRTWVPGLPASLNIPASAPPHASASPSFLLSALSFTPRAPPAHVPLCPHLNPQPFSVAHSGVILSGTRAALRKPEFLGWWFLTWLPVTSLGSFHSFLPRVERPLLCGPGECPACCQHRTLMLGVHVGPFCPGRWWSGTLELVSRGGRCRVRPVPTAELGQPG